MTMNLARQIAGALGNEPADIVLRDGLIVNVFTQEVSTGDLAITDGRITSVGQIPAGALGASTETIDIAGSYVVPGFIDAHFHVGGSSLPIEALSAALLERGTTTLATDLYEMYAMSGLEGVRACFELAEHAGLRLLFMAPLHLLGLEEYGTFRHPPSAEEFLEMMRWEQTIAVNEPPPFVVLRGNDDVLRVIAAALAQRKVFEGHAVGIGGADLQGYVAAGASSDHEALEADEALEKLRLGYRIIMREGSASRDLPNIVELLLRFPQSSRFFMVCSDEMEPKDLVAEGHVDHKLRKVIEAGVDPVVAIQLATINIAEYFGLADEIGSLSPGKSGDVLVLDDLEELRPRMVIARGRVVARKGEFALERPEHVSVPDVLKSRIELDHAPVPRDFRIGASVENGLARVRVIGIVDGTLVSDALEHECEVRDGEILPDPDNDVLKVAVLERHHASGRVGRGLMSGLHLTQGAVAMTYCHVHQNLLVVGTSDEEMARAAAEIVRIGGGIVVVCGRDIVKALPLPIGGVLGTAQLAEMHRELTEAEDAIRSLGCRLTAPILSLSFSVLPHIPAYGLTDFGFYDSIAESFVEIVLDVNQEEKT